jgi:imidazolonepropionase-like amidohydrolase
VHANATEAIRRAVDAGVDGIEHCTFLRAPDDIEFDPRVGEEIARRGTYVGPTLAVNHAGLEHARARWSELSAQERARWEQRFRARDVRFEILGQMVRQGAKFVASSDAGWSYYPFGRFVQELELLAQIGLPTPRVLAAGTRLAAEAVGLASDVGTLEPGKIADVLVVAGNPTQRLADLWNVKAVFRSGRMLVEDGRLVA